AEAWRLSGQPLPTISTDLHKRSVLGPAFDLQTVMTKMLAVGSSIDDVLRSATVRPATVTHTEASLAVGAPADVAVLDVLSHPENVWDSRGMERVAPRQLRCRLTLL